MSLGKGVYHGGFEVLNLRNRWAMKPLTEVGKIMNSVWDLFHLRALKERYGHVTWTVNNTDLFPNICLWPLTYDTGPSHHHSSLLPLNCLYFYFCLSNLFSTQKIEKSFTKLPVVSYCTCLVLARSWDPSLTQYTNYIGYCQFLLLLEWNIHAHTHSLRLEHICIPIPSIFLDI